MATYASHTQDLVYELNMIKTQSKDLTLHFFSDLVRIQEEKVSAGDKERGELLVTVEYDRDKKALHVHVIQGRHLPVMDKAGGCGHTALQMWNW